MSVVLALALAALLIGLFECAAHAAAPGPNDPQHDMLAPFSDWITHLTNPTNGQGCCSTADCRMVDYQTSADGSGYEAFISRETFPQGPNAWIKVPNEVVIHRPNPTGFAVACWAVWHRDTNGYFCFAPSSAT